jgi:hypothetical protein
MKQLVSAVLIFATTTVTAQTFKPALKLPTGAKYTIIVNTKGTINQEAMGQTMEMPIEGMTVSTLEVKAATATEYSLNNNTDRITFASSVMGQDMNYDSDKKEDKDSPLSKEMGALVGNPTDFKVNAFGKVIDGSVKKQSPEKQEPGGGMFSGMINTGGENVPSPVINLFETDAAMSVGDSFSIINNSADGKNKKSTTFKLVEVKDGVAKFIVNGTDVVAKEMELQGMQAAISTSAKSTGEMFVNTATGLLIKNTITITMSGNMDMMGMSIPMSGTTSVTVSVAEAAKAF